MKKISSLTILIIFTVFWLSGCFYRESASNNSSKKYVPESFKNVALTDIYGKISSEKSSQILSSPAYIVQRLGLPEIERIEIATDSEGSDPNMLKSYLRYRRANILIKEGFPTAKYKNILNDFLDYADKYPDSVPLQKKVVENYLTSDRQYAAIRQAKKVLSIDPNDMETAISIAAVYNETGRYTEAIQYLNLALGSDQSGTDNVYTAVATLHMATAFSELGYTYAAAQSYLRAWQLMRYHRQFSHYDPGIQKVIDSSEFQLLLSSRLFLQCGMVDSSIKTLREVKLGPNFQQLIAYLTPMVIELPESQKVRMNLLTHLYLYLLADGENPDYVLRLFYNNCLDMSLHNEYIKIVQAWYASSLIDPNSPELVSRYSYARALEYAKRHTEARLVLKNCEPGYATSSAWLDFARIDRANKSYTDMLNGYIYSIDTGPQELEPILIEFENILRYDSDAKAALIKSVKSVTKKTFGAFLIEALIAENNKQILLAEKFYRSALNKESHNVTARKYLIRLYARVGKYQKLLDLARGYKQPDITMYVARTYQSLSKYDKAINCYMRILAVDKYNQQAVIRLADLYRSRGNFSDAEKLLLRSARRHPEQDMVQVELIKLYSIWSMTENSDEEISDRCIERSYKLADEFFNRYSDSQRMQEKAETVLQDKLEEVLDTFKNCKPARAILCASYFRAKKIDNAVNHASRLMNMFSDDFKILGQAAEIFETAEKYDYLAVARKLIWQKHLQSPESLKGAMKASRFAGLPSESLIMLNEGKNVFGSDIKFIETIADEAFDTYLILRNYDEGIDSLSSWLAACDNDYQEVAKSLDYKLALLYTYDSQFGLAAEKLLSIYSEISDSNIFAIQMLVRSLNIRGKYSDSIAFLEDIIKVLPDNIFIMLEYAYTKIESGSAEDAIAFIENWQRENPEASNRQYALFNTYKRADRYEKAIELTRQRLRDNSDDVDLLVDLVYCLIYIGDEQSLNEASGILDGLADRNADPYKWFDYRIILDLARGNPDVASERLLEMTSDPDSPAVVAAQARIYYLSGDDKKAIDMYEKLVRDYPDEISYRSQLGFVLENSGYIDKAIEQLNVIHELDSDNPMSKNNLAYTMINYNREPERAGRLIREAIYMAPESVAILDSVGWLYYKQGEFKTALNYIYHAAAADIIVDPELMDHLGDTLYRLGQPKKAIIYWKRGLKEVSKRVVMEKNLQQIKDRYQRKIEQFNADQVVDTAELFNELMEK